MYNSIKHRIPSKLAHLKELKTYNAATIIVVLSILYIFVYSNLLKFIPKIYVEFIHVPIVVVLIYMLEKAENGHLFDHLFKRPKNWRHEWRGAVYKFFVALIAEGIVHFTATKLGLAKPQLGVLNPIKGHPLLLFMMYFQIWTAIAFGEEIIFRGFVMTRIKRIVGDDWVGRTINVLLASTIFGFFHLYQGWSGTMRDIAFGIVLSINFIYKKYNLWQNIMIHGFSDTIGITFNYF